MPPLPPPPEQQQQQQQPPWDRKEILKERRPHPQPQPPSPTTPPIPFRWRDSSPREFNRWGSSADFRRPPGHGKQGGWHTFVGEAGHGYSSRSSDKMSEDEGFRSRGGVKYGRSNNIRENRASLSQREWKGHSWDTNNGSSNAPVSRPQLHGVNGNNIPRPVDDTLTSPNHPNTDFANTLDQHNSSKVDGERIEGENTHSLEWKPLKWTRSGSLSSRGSGLSHSSSSKSMGGGVDSHEGKTAELQPKSVTPIQSPSGDVVACATSAAPCEKKCDPDVVTSRKKKPRLGWGEGLAKYEKKKVEPDEKLNKTLVSVNDGNGDTVSVNSLNHSEKSPRVVPFTDCATPATPSSSVACSFSPGVEEKSMGRAASVENDFNNLCGSPCNGLRNQLEGFAFNLEKLDMALVANLGSSLIELLQADESCAVDSSFVRSTTMNKLLVWKSELSKALELTESEIDSLESELKRMKSVSGRRCPCPAASSSLPVDTSVPCEEQQAAFNLISRPTPLNVEPHCNGTLQDVHANGKDEDVDSPGTATSKFVEPLSLVKTVFPTDVVNQSVDVEVKCLEPELNGEDNNGDSMMLMRRSDDVSNVVSQTDGEDTLCNLILASNKELAAQASEVFSNLLPRDLSKINVSGVFDVSFLENDPVIKKKVSTRKRLLRFKERVLTLKFRAFHHLWKEDMHMLSVKKYRAKYQKKCELSLRTINGGLQKHRSSVRSRLCSPGTLSLVPTTEIVNFTSKLLSDSEVRPFRDSLKMPALVLDRKEKLASRFISNNGLVEDPFAVEKERTTINPWTATEKEVFLDKLSVFGKDFKKISSFLDHKTTADCVQFYYKNHKSECFEKTKKKQGKSSLNTYMMTSEKRWSRDMNAASLDILGAASVMAANAESGVGNRPSRMSIDPNKFICDEERSSSYDIIGNERETVAADVLAGICGSLSSEAMSSCITSSVDPGEWKCQKVDSVIQQQTLTSDDDTCSDESCGEMDPTPNWTTEEKSAFMLSFTSYGKDFVKISRRVRTKSSDQCKVFYSKVRKCLGLDMMHPGPGNVGSPPSDYGNGDESDTEDACVVETNSAVSSDKLDSSKVNDDLLLSDKSSVPDKNMKLQTDLRTSEENNDMEKDKDAGTVISNMCGAPMLVVNGSVTDKQCDSVHARNMAITVEAVKHNPSNSGAVAQMSANGFGNKFSEVSTGDHLNTSGQTDDVQVSEKTSLLVAADTSPLSGLSHDSERQHQVSTEKSCIVLENNLASTNFGLQGSGPVQKLHEDRLSANHDSLKTIRDDYRQLMESSQILSGYPLRIPTKKEMMNGDIRLSEVQSHSKSERINGQYWSPDYYVQKCSTKAARCMADELSQKSVQKGDQPRVRSRSLSDTEKPSKNGDVKLFGKILSKSSSSSSQNNDPVSNGNKGLSNHHSNQGATRSSTLEFSGHPSVLKLDRNNYLGLENFATRSRHGLWDGNNRMQSGFTSMPDSALLLAKYPAAFGNHLPVSSSSKMDSQQTLSQNGNHTLNGISVFPPSSTVGAMMDYEIYRRRDSTKVVPPPFTVVDMKQPKPQDVFLEMQRRNGFDAIVSLQQQMVVGTGGVLVGGPCTAVSDPVAAIKMHYAKAEQYGGGQAMREDDRWGDNRGK